MPSRREATSGGSTAARTPRATSSPRPPTERSCVSTGTRPSTRAGRRRARFTSALSFCSGRATTGRRGSESRRISPPTTRRSRNRSSRGALPSTTLRPRCTRRSIRFPNRPWTERSSGSARTTATCNSRATAERPGRMSSGMSRGFRSRRG